MTAADRLSDQCWTTVQATAKEGICAGTAFTQIQTLTCKSSDNDDQVSTSEPGERGDPDHSSEIRTLHAALMDEHHDVQLSVVRGLVLFLG